MALHGVCGREEGPGRTQLAASGVDAVGGLRVGTHETLLMEEVVAEGTRDAGLTAGLARGLSSGLAAGLD